MKYKGGDSSSSGVGKSRSVGSSSAANTRLLRDDKTRHAKIEKNDGGALRRSSRRATIERRVWAVPKKSTKATTGTTATKDKIPYKPPKREKEKREPEKPQNKTNLKSKASQGIKRGPITVEEAGNARRKVKKKEGAKDVHHSVESSTPVATAKKINAKVTSKQAMNTQNHDCEDVSKNLLSLENKSSISNSFTNENESKCDVNLRTDNSCSKSILHKKESQNSDAEVSLNEDDEIDCDRRLEESLYTGEVCLNTAVIEEVVPDYDVSSFPLSDSTEDCSVSSDKGSLVNSSVNENDYTDKQSNSLDSDSNVALKNKNKKGPTTIKVTEDTNTFDGPTTEDLSLEKESCINQGKVSDCNENTSGEVLTSTKSVDLEDINIEPDVSEKLQSEIGKELTMNSSYQNTRSKKHKMKINMKVKPTKEFVTNQELDETGSGTIVNIVEKVSVPHSTIKASTRTEKGDAMGEASGTVLVDKSGIGETIRADEVDGQEDHVETMVPRTDEVDLGVTMEATVMDDDDVGRTIDGLESLEMKSNSSGSGETMETMGNRVDKAGEFMLGETTSGTVVEKEVDGQSRKSKEAVIVRAKKNSGIDEPVRAVIMKDDDVDGGGKTMEPIVMKVGSDGGGESVVKNAGSGGDESGRIGEPMQMMVMEAGSGGGGSSGSGVLGAMTMEEGNSQEDHVSLSVALAQLVDDGDCDLTEGSETVTIHSALPGIQAEEKSAQEIISLDVNGSTKESMMCKPLTISTDDDEDDDDVEGELVIKEEDDGEEGEARSEFDTDEEEELSRPESKRENKPDALASSKEVPDLSKPPDTKKETERMVTSPTPPPTKPKKQIPPLIKISSKPPAIKTPLKCPECPMQFCTVRSLLWHFGTHGARSRDNCLPPILLQDLIVPWDKPTMSLFLSQPSESDKSSDKVVNISENLQSLPVISGDKTKVKVDMIGKQDIITATPIIRTDDYLGTNGDVILKVPIPRLKPKVMPVTKKDKFVSILPKRATAGDGPPSLTPGPTHLASIKPTNSPTPKITIHPQGNRIGDITTPKQSKSVPKITIRGDSSEHQVQIKPIIPASSSPPAVQIQPLISSSQSAVQIQPLISSQSAIQIQPLVSSPSAIQIQPLVSPSQSAIQIQPIVSSSQSAIQIQPIVSSSQSAIQIQPLVSSTPSSIQVQPVLSSSKSSPAPGHIALIPMDNLATVGQNFTTKTSRPKLGNAPLRMISPSSLPGKTAAAAATSPVDGIIEKDGLVMINSNLALRIVSSLPCTTLDTGTSTTNTTTIRPIASHLTNNLTILPQVEGSKLSNSKRELTKNPDILTIVPQVDPSRKLSLLKPAAAGVPPITSVQTPIIPKSTSSSSSSSSPPVVKFFLLQPNEVKSRENTVKISIASDPTNKLNGLEIPISYPNGNEKVNYDDSLMCEEVISDDDFDDEDEGMVIDDEEREGEEDVMDPLSLCAVTMEDENIDGANNGTQSEGTSENASTTLTDKVEIKVKTKGKNHQGVDIVKYEARRYVCCYCNRRFGWSTDLKRHVILHTGEKPFECKVCPTAFTRKFLLQNHMKRMHPDKCKMSDLWP
ncbi:hypothetical protein Pcinc_023083 [Petrolisthes cinctipes]|uniref:C2H2-type domain-containing protein n=1 Tax=Petrolisthes cinctipes TaxID=88211 RepID=A0AAE1FDU1_PETCI|nr:hypothetical protein Pcinc_023083 [Petrolisthes cinctipes]